jgi:hypothetical protein
VLQCRSTALHSRSVRGDELKCRSSTTTFGSTTKLQHIQALKRSIETAHLVAQFRETVWPALQKMGNGGDRIVAVAFRLGSRQQRAQGAIAASVSRLNLAIDSFPTGKAGPRAGLFPGMSDKLSFGHPSFDQANLGQEALGVLTLRAKPAP